MAVGRQARQPRIGVALEQAADQLAGDRRQRHAVHRVAGGHRDAVPVVTAAGVLLGLVTATDLVAAIAHGGLPVAAHADSWKHGDRG